MNDDNLQMRTIGVLTSGGDAPGMNACVRAVVRTGLYHNLNIIGIRRGFEGLFSSDYNELRARDVGDTIQRGGTMLGTARCQAFYTEEGRLQAFRNLQRSRVDGLIVIGGDGSLTGANYLHKLGFPVVGIPASIDNDVYGTDMSIGVDTALNTIQDAIDKLRDTATSHERTFLVEVMGRRSGYLAVMSGVSCGAEQILVPEVDFTLDEVGEVIAEAFARKKRHAIIIVAEGARYSVNEIASWLEAQDQYESNIRVTVLGHIQRGGRPTAFDRLLAARMGHAAVMGLLNGQRGVMAALRGNRIDFVPLDDVGTKQRELRLSYYELARTLAQ